MKYASLLNLACSSFVGRHGRRSRRAVTGRRRFQPTHTHNLEERIALSTVPAPSSPALIQAISANEAAASRSHSVLYTKRHVLNSASDGSADVQPNGDIVVSVPNANLPGTTYTYQHEGSGWKMIAQTYYRQIGEVTVYVEDSWAANGTLVEYGLAGDGLNVPEYFQLDVTSKHIRLTEYDVDNYPIYYGAQSAASKDATVRYIYARSAKGGTGDLLQYDVSQPDTSWAANWVNQTKNPNSGYYSSGWLEYYPNHYSIQVPSPEQNLAWQNHNGGDDLIAYVNAVAVAQQQGNPVISIPKYVTEQHGQQNGQPADTFWNTAHTDSITFVYGGADNTTLIAQTYGTDASGKWVTTTTEPGNSDYSQTATYDKLGGTLETSSTTFTAANGNVATLNGTWTSGTAVDNATGTETASNYLDFSAVTIQVRNGTPVTRAGSLSQGGYATDTYNSSGTAVIKREIANAPGDPISQTLTGSGNNVTVVWFKPNSSTTQESLEFEWDAKHFGYPGQYSLTNFSAQFAKEVQYTFGSGPEGNTTWYRWRAFASYNRNQGDWQLNFRESANGASEANASDEPGGGTPITGTAPMMDQYWNKA